MGSSLGSNIPRALWFLRLASRAVAAAGIGWMDVADALGPGDTFGSTHNELFHKYGDWLAPHHPASSLRVPNVP